MEQLRKGNFVGIDTIEFPKLDNVSEVIPVSGEISCLGDIVIKVRKFLKVTEEDSLDPLVQTFSYKYNASVTGEGTFLRHDNAHSRPGHPTDFHKHNYEAPDFDKIDKEGKVTHVGYDGWPSLSDFVEEAASWYYNNRHKLKNPSAYGVLERRG